MATATKATKTTKTRQSPIIKQSRKPSAKKPAPYSSALDRQHMIAEAAYFRAQKRGFTGGQEMDDWLEAETEIDKAL